MNEAIKLAIEKGGFPATWDEKAKAAYYGLDPRDYVSAYVVFEPAFWQALGYALGWKGGTYKYEWFHLASGDFAGGRVGVRPWQYHALRYFELHMTGGDEEKFWKELLLA
jgi:hypothetical protein